ncbi:cyanophycinase [Terrimonas sp. NA20]|uniref:Cyanophycinase n=1 Tax=Terrimonas ginsenosidimutans TaxID=2908004 RepID=A0ABS9KXY7_9BACT|nr:cyanophycinase [Terrimonas ginsenosidimutans]MCG2617217.1 cyanophycinase [Terrimonas ginsenosidimutans]
MYLKLTTLLLSQLFSIFLFAQTNSPKGKLFIIGGGDRPPGLMKAMIDAANLSPQDYIGVLPMSSGEKDTSFHYFKLSVAPVCNNPVVNLDFTKETVNNRSRLDSLEKAKLIFITGGQQTRFMKVVLNTPVYDAIHKAYRNGAMIAGTSAGAAVMSEKMITGTQLLPEAKGKEGFTMVKAGNVEFEEGLGLIKTAIIDQHFIVRSRYNRLLTALHTFPELICVGIDEETAILVSQGKAEVAGDGQVVVLRDPQKMQVKSDGVIGVKKASLSLFVKGDSFSVVK